MSHNIDQIGKTTVFSLYNEQEFLFVGVCAVWALCTTYAIENNLSSAMFTNTPKTYAELAAKVSIGRVSIGLGDFAVHLGEAGVKEARLVIQSIVADSLAA